MLTKLKLSSFSRNVATLLTGNIFAQSFPLVCMPVLTRIYAPEDFGLLALFTAIVLTLGAIVNGRYEMALMLPRKDDDALHVAAVGMVFSSFLSLFLLLIVLLFSSELASLAGNDELKIWLYFVPVVVWLIGLFNILNYLNTRFKNYKDIAASNVYKSSFMVSVQLFFGFFSLTNIGLLSGLVVSHFVGNFRLLKGKVNFYKKHSFSIVKIIALAKRYKDFPKYSLPAIFANNLSTYSTSFSTSILYDMKTLGYYSLSQKVLGLPTALIGSSIGQVYYQQAAAEKKLTGKAILSFNQTLKKLFFVSIVLFIPLFFLCEYIFALAFGSEWRIAGEYASILIPFFAVRFIAASLSTTNSLFEKQIYSLIWQVCYLFLSLLLIFIAYFNGFDFKFFLVCYSLVMSIHYIILLVILYHVSKGRV